MGNRVIIEQNNNQVVTDRDVKYVTVVNPDCEQVRVLENVTNIVTVIAPGPQGPQGPPGNASELGAYLLTSSFNAFTASYNTGSFSGSFTGQFLGTSSWSSNAVSSSYALTASYAANVPNTASYSLQSLSSSYSITASYALNVPQTASYAIQALSSSYSTTSSYALTASYALNVPSTASYASQSLSSSYSLTASYALNVPSTASYALQALSSSYSVQSLSSSFASTASYAPLYLPLTGGTINGNVVINGTASISYLNVTFESASVVYSSGSNQFGDAANDIQTLYGTVNIPTGSLIVTGSVISTEGFTGSLLGSSSYAIQSLSSSYSVSSSLSNNSYTASSVNFLTQSAGDKVEYAIIRSNNDKYVLTTYESSTVGSDHLYLATRNLNWTGSSVSSRSTSQIIAIGSQALQYADVDGSSRNGVAVGAAALRNLRAGMYNVGIGVWALEYLANGQRNVAIGEDAGGGITTGSFNTYLGAEAGYGNNQVTASHTNVIALGYRALFSSPPVPLSNTTVIGTSLNTSLNNIVLLGRSDQNVLIGAPSVDNGAKLQILGSVSASSDITAPSFTGSFFGTSSWSNNSISSSYSLTASYWSGSVISSSYSLTASYALNAGGASINTSSFATTGSNTFRGTQIISGSVILPQLTSQVNKYVVSYDTASGQLYYQITSSGGGSGTPGGSSGQIQYNNAGAFDGVATLTYVGGNLYGTGSFTGSFTGALIGTASWSNNSVTSSYAIGYVLNSQTSSMTVLSASFASTASLSFKTSGSMTGSLLGTSSFSNFAISASYIDGGFY